MTDEQRSWTVDDSTTASNPGNVTVSRLRWLLHYPRWPLTNFTLLAACAALAVVHYWSWWVFAALALALNLFYWARVGEHFRHGCINPGLVVAIDPTLIAVGTDLSKGDGNYPAIKIIRAPLTSAQGQAIAPGLRVATVALYAQGEDEDAPHWDDFDPRPVDCATADPNALRRSLESIDDEEWDDLRDALVRVPEPHEPGLHRLWPDPAG